MELLHGCGNPLIWNIACDLRRGRKLNIVTHAPRPPLPHRHRHRLHPFQPARPLATFPLQLPAILRHDLRGTLLGLVLALLYVWLAQAQYGPLMAALQVCCAAPCVCHAVVHRAVLRRAAVHCLLRGPVLLQGRFLR